MDAPILKIDSISKSYGRKQVLSDVSLDVYPGEIIGIIGASGSGKTTLLNSLVGFIKADSGDVLFKEPALVGTDTVIYKSVYKQQRKFKRVYGFAAQIPSFYEKLTVKENLSYFGSLYDLSLDTLQTNVQTLLKLMNLNNASYILGKNLSGGMERRLDIACALVHNPQLLILDEPTADLDPVLRNNIWDLLKQINSKGTTILLSSHHLNELETLCTRIAIIKDGMIFDKGTPDELKNKYLKNQELVIETYPANYDASGAYLKRAFSKNVQDFKVSGGHLILTCKEPEKIISSVMSKLEKRKEKVLEIKIVKPSLDQLFISLSDKKNNFEKVKDQFDSNKDSKSESESKSDLDKVSDDADKSSRSNITKKKKTKKGVKVKKKSVKSKKAKATKETLDSAIDALEGAEDEINKDSN